MGVPFGESVPINAWSCAQCHSVHRERSEADECCTCSNCGAKFKKEGYIGTCESCSYGSSLRSARDEVERSRNHYNYARDRLEKLISAPPAGKKRPKLDQVPPRDDSYTHPDGTHDKSAWASLYAARDWLRSLASSLEGQTELSEACADMADRVERGINATGGKGH